MTGAWHGNISTLLALCEGNPLLASADHQHCPIEDKSYRMYFQGNSSLCMLWISGGHCNICKLSSAYHKVKIYIYIHIILLLKNYVLSCPGILKFDTENKWAESPKICINVFCPGYLNCRLWILLVTPCLLTWIREFIHTQTFLCLYISCWWCQTWDTAPYFKVVNQSEARISTEHGINRDTI